jgi:hypothetical protein
MAVSSIAALPLDWRTLMFVTLEFAAASNDTLRLCSDAALATGNTQRGADDSSAAGAGPPRSAPKSA